jgi:hypothetical protein
MRKIPMVSFRFESIDRSTDQRATALAATTKRRRKARRPSSHRPERLFAESLEGRAMLATIMQVSAAPGFSSAVGIGSSIDFQVEYDAPVAVLSAPVALVNVAKASGAPAIATFTGPSGGGRMLNFRYTVEAGDTQPGNQFDVLMDPAAFLIGGTIRDANTNALADRMVVSAELTLADLNSGLRVDGVAPSAPTVEPVMYVNPIAWQPGNWALIHPDYFVIRGTAGTGPLPADEVLTVTVNGATYRATSTSSTAPGNFFVDSGGAWEIRIRPVGGLPATAPFSGSLDPWSTTDSAAYNVVARLTDAAGNVSTDSQSLELVIDMIPPAPAQLSGVGGSYKAGDVVQLWVQFDGPVRVIGNPTLGNLNITPSPAVASYDPVATAAYAPGTRVYFSYTVQPGQMAVPLGFIGNAVLNLNGGAIEDQAANAWNPSSQALPTPSLPLILIDTLSPTVVTPFVSSTSPNGTYVVGSPPITLTVTFSEPVFVTPPSPPAAGPLLQLNAFPGRVATYAGGSGTNVLSFTYVVQAGDNTPDLDYLSNTALQLNGSQIRDAVGNNATLTLPAPGSPASLAAQRNIVVSAAAQVVQVSSPDAAGTYSAGDTVRLRVVFDKATAPPVSTIQLDTLPIPAVATWNGLYIDAAGNATTNPTNILQYSYLVKPGDTTAGAFLNYLADGVLPAPSSSLNILPNAQIVISPDTTPPAAPVARLAVDTTNSLGVSPTDGITSNPQVIVSGLETQFGAAWQYQYQFEGGPSSGWLTGGPIAFNGTASLTLPTTNTTPVPPTPTTLFPVGSVQIRQIDWSGNVSSLAVNPQQWRLDVNAPAAPTAVTIAETGGSGSGITSNGTATVAGLETSGIFEYNRTFNAATGAVTGPWTAVASGDTFILPAGTYNPATGTGVVVRQQDLAGNYSLTWTQLRTSSGGTTIIVDPSRSTDPLPPPPPQSGTIEAVGNVTLAINANGQLTANGTLIRFDGNPVSATNASWTFLAAETIGGVNTLVLRHTSGFLHLWLLDASWNFVAGEGWYGPTTSGFYATEVDFGMDFNGDGIVGSPLTPIESRGSVKLARDTAGFLRANGTAIRFNGGQVRAENDTWSFLAAETISGVNTLVLRHGNGFLHLWHLDSSWNFETGVGWYTPGSTAFYATEVDFGMDFGGDGVVGNPVIESVGSVTLSRDANGFLQANGTLVRFSGSPVSVANSSWAFLAADVIGGVNSMVLRHSSGFLHVWRLDLVWNFVSGEGWYAPGTVGFAMTEADFGMDFDGNGVVGG